MSRYIDADEVKRQVERATQGQTDVMKVLLNVLHRIERIPTADARENVKGEWKLRENQNLPMWHWYECSNCGAVIGTPTRFCSECGTDMRGGKE